MHDGALIRALLARISNGVSTAISISPCRGGDIHRSYRVDTDPALMGESRLFVKLNSLDYLDVLEAEFTSLFRLAMELELDYPKPVSVETDEQNCYLLMRFHNLGSMQADSATAAQLGTMLAQQHRLTAATFGWYQDNFIGLNRQQNRRCNNWPEFFAGERLQPQLQLAIDNGLDRSLIEQLSALTESLAVILAGHNPVPALLHGDLWGGNAGYDLDSGKPVLYDPAPYYGDRETDLAMTELFGGFPPDFYRAYRQAWPLPVGYPQRKPLYNLYHALNHFNLFGAGYTNMVSSLLAQLKAD